jgi:hypothetical protein
MLRGADLRPQPTMREFVAQMTSETKAGEPRFSAKSIENYLAVIKSVVASVLNDKEEPMYPLSLCRWRLARLR